MRTRTWLAILGLGLCACGMPREHRDMSQTQPYYDDLDIPTQQDRNWRSSAWTSADGPAMPEKNCCRHACTKEGKDDLDAN
jgi:hypothetical protein